MGERPLAVVVGGGVGGLAAAIGLRAIGWQVKVLERSAQLGEVGSGLALWANALAALETLGVAEDVRTIGTANLGGSLRTVHGRWLKREPSLDPQQQPSMAVLLMVDRKSVV